MIPCSRDAICADMPSGPTPDGYYLLFFIGNPQVTARHCQCLCACFVSVWSSILFLTHMPPGANNASGMIDCRDSIPPVPIHPNPPSNEYITMAWSKSITGPWKQRVILNDLKDNQTSWHCIENNPSAVILPKYGHQFLASATTS